MIKRPFAVVMIGMLAIAIAASAQAQLRGHGGPVRALAISPDGKIAVSGALIRR
jgi:cytochrome c